MLVLDDCTSALDPATERRVLDGLDGGRGRQVLHITQKVRVGPHDRSDPGAGGGGWV